MDKVKAGKNRIAELIVEKDELLKTLGELPEIWASEIPSVIEGGINYVTSTQVKNNPDAVKEMGEENIKSLKNAIQKIKDGLTETCKVEGELPHLSGGLPKNANAKNLDRAAFLDFFTPIVGQAMGPFEQLINESGLSKNSSHHWFGEKGARTMASQPAAFAEYVVAWEGYVALISKLEGAEKALHQLEAEDLWASS